MRKFWVVLLSIGLIVAFTMPVCAADVKFSGSYIAQGYYENNRSLRDNPEGSGLSNVWQKLRVQTVFQIQEGLSLTTRFDAMEKVWGASRSATATSTNSGAQSAEAQNIKFELAYISANIAGGLFRAGYQQQSKFGTDFGDSGDQDYGPRVRYDYVMGPLTVLALWDKVEGQKYYNGTSQTLMEKDQNKYDVAFMYNFKGGSTGLLFVFLNDTSTKPTADGGYIRQWYVFDPFVKATFGPVYIEGELFYVAGKTRTYEDGVTGQDRKKGTLSAYLMAMGNFGPAYVGIAGVYIPGDKYDTNDKDESGYPGGVDFNPCLMLFNYDLGRWNGNYGSGSAVGGGGQMANAMVGQVFGGIKPIPKLDIKLSYTYAKAQTDPAANWQDKFYGHEVDLTATYKIYDNLSYMIGGAYLFAGDYWKGTSATAEITNDYLLTHKLILTF